jgi:hypothetical protein
MAVDPDESVFTAENTTDELLKVSTVTGEATVVASLALDNVELAITPVVVPAPIGTFPAGTLFGMGQGDQNLYTIDKATGVETAVGPIGSAFNLHGLAFRQDGTLFGAQANGAGNDELITIDTSTGARTVIGTITPSFTVGDLAFTSNGTLLVSDAGVPNRVLELNQATAATSNDVTLTTTGFVLGLSFVNVPLIVSASDVGNDQGRQLRINLLSSCRDTGGSPTPIIQYEAFRRIDALPKPAALVSSESEARRAIALARGMLSDPSILIAGWEFTGAVPAHGSVEYNMIAPTLADSTISSGMHWSVFFIRAATNDPLTFFDSPADSGYSLDNLAPMAPLSLVVAMSLSSGPSLVYDTSQGGANLSWLGVEDEDFDYYAIYRDVASGFAPSVSNRIGFTTDVTFVDWLNSPGTYYYLVTALDFSGNESQPSNEAMLAVRTSDTMQLPAVYSLGQNRPNPFNPSTKISFELPNSGKVNLEIYNVRGEIVARLLEREMPAGRHTVQWDGTDRNGVRVPSGEYIYRIEAGAFTDAKKMMLLK